MCAVCLLGPREKVVTSTRTWTRDKKEVECERRGRWKGKWRKSTWGRCRWSTLIIIMKAIIVIDALSWCYIWVSLHYHQRLIGRQIVAHTHTHIQIARERENKGKQQQKANLRLLVTLLVLRPFRSCLSAPMQASRRSCRRRRSRSRCLRCAGLRCAALYAIQILCLTVTSTGQQNVIARQQAAATSTATSSAAASEHCFSLCRHTPIFEHCALSPWLFLQYSHSLTLSTSSAQPPESRHETVFAAAF